MKRDYIYLPIIVALAILAIWQESRIRRVEAGYALPPETAGVSGKAPGLVNPRPSLSRDQGAVAVKSPGPLPPSRPSSDRMDGAEISIEEGVKKERLMKIRQRVEARLLAWKGPLNLSAGQEAQLRAAMESGERKLEVLSRTKPEKGAPFQAFLEEGAALQLAQEEEIKSLLSEDQRAALEEQKTQELRTKAEVQAGKQMAKLQENLILTGEQQDAAFQMYAQQAMAFDPVKIIREGREPAAVLEEQRMAAKELLQQILTPEQFKLFARQEEERRSLKRERGF